MGEENLSPHKYEGYRVGPLQAVVTLDKHDTVLSATAEALKELKVAYDKIFLTQRDKYYEHHAAK